MGPRTMDTQWRPNSKISEKLGRCGRQNMLRPYLRIWEWEWILGCAVKALSVVRGWDIELVGWKFSLINDLSVTNGQSISEWIYEVIVSPKRWTKIVKISAFATQGRNLDNFLFIFSAKRCLHKFILKLTDLYCRKLIKMLASWFDNE